jgi:hypothetical protein
MDWIVWLQLLLALLLCGLCYGLKTSLENALYTAHKVRYSALHSRKRPSSTPQDDQA